MQFGKKKCPKCRPCKVSPQQAFKTVKFIVEHSPPQIKEKIEKFVHKIPPPPPPPPPPKPKPKPRNEPIVRSKNNTPSFLDELKKRQMDGSIKLKKSESKKPSGSFDFISELKKKQQEGTIKLKAPPKSETQKKKTYLGLKGTYLEELENAIKKRKVEFGTIKYLLTLT
jgi:hypothetical protein